jgi:uncharacterized protein YacL
MSRMRFSPLSALIGLTLSVTLCAALFLVPSGFMFTVFDFFMSPVLLSMGAGVALTVGTAQFFKPKIEAFIDSVTHRTVDRYAMRCV